jgi:hypothetical protein
LPPMPGGCHPHASARPDDHGTDGREHAAQPRGRRAEFAMTARSRSSFLGARPYRRSLQ